MASRARARVHPDQPYSCAYSCARTPELSIPGSSASCPKLKTAQKHPLRANAGGYGHTRPLPHHRDSGQACARAGAKRGASVQPLACSLATHCAGTQAGTGWRRSASACRRTQSRRRCPRRAAGRGPPHNANQPINFERPTTGYGPLAMHWRTRDSCANRTCPRPCPLTPSQDDMNRIMQHAAGALAHAHARAHAPPAHTHLERQRPAVREATLAARRSPCVLWSMQRAGIPC